MKRKALACVLTAAMALALFTGCGNEGSGEGSSTPGGSTGENSEVTDVALKVWCPQNQVDSGIMEEQQTAFAAEHPEWNITWTTEIVGEDNCKTEILKDVDAAADVFLFSSDQLIELVDTGAIAQLGGAAEAMVKDTNSEAVRATAMVGDATYAIPFTHNTFSCFMTRPSWMRVT